MEGSDPNVVDPAAGDEARQFIAGYLQRLRGPQLQQVEEDMKCLVSYAQQAQWPEEQLSFLKAFLDDYGVGGETA